MEKREIQGNPPLDEKHATRYCHTTYAYRISLVKDKEVSFSSKPVSASNTGADAIRDTIANAGQWDRENLIVLMLNAKNEIIGTNVVSQGCLNRCIVTIV